MKKYVLVGQEIDEYDKIVVGGRDELVIVGDYFWEEL